MRSAASLAQGVVSKGQAVPVAARLIHELRVHVARLPPALSMVALRSQAPGCAHAVPVARGACRYAQSYYPHTVTDPLKRHGRGPTVSSRRGDRVQVM